MQGLNRIELIGNLGADPELRESRNGNAILNLRVAATDRVKRGDEWVDDTQWFTCVLFGKRATAVSELLRKGSRVYVAGRFQTREYEARDGSTQRVGEVVASDLILLDSRRAEGAGAANTPGTTRSPSTPRRDKGDDDDDIPF